MAPPPPGGGGGGGGGGGPVTPRLPTGHGPWGPIGGFTQGPGGIPNIPGPPGPPPGPPPPIHPPLPPHMGPWGRIATAGPTGPRIPIGGDPADPTGASQLTRWERLARGANQLRQFGINPLTASFDTLSQGIGNVTRAAGPAAVGIATIGFAAYAAHKSMQAFGATMKDWGQMQKQTGLEIGFMKNVTDQFARQGFDEGQVKASMSSSRTRLRSSTKTHRCGTSCRPCRKINGARWRTTSIR